jgi:hypothetical protein
MPKAARGRRPAPNPKKRAQRFAPRPATAATGASALADEQEVAEGVEPIRTQRPVASTSSATVRRSSAAIPVRRRLAETITDYSYVKRDLQMIAGLATTLVVVLVVLSLVIR